MNSLPMIKFHAWSESLLFFLLEAVFAISQIASRLVDGISVWFELSFLWISANPRMSATVRLPFLWSKVMSVLPLHQGPEGSCGTEGIWHWILPNNQHPSIEKHTRSKARRNSNLMARKPSPHNEDDVCPRIGIRRPLSDKSSWHEKQHYKNR